VSSINSTASTVHAAHQEACSARCSAAVDRATDPRSGLSDGRVEHCSIFPG
jgi:hypothetical protein